MSTSRLSLQRFSLILIVTLFLCQVIGTFCPMVVPIASPAQPALHDLHTGHAHSAHTMSGEGMCPDSLVTSMETIDIPLDSLSIDIDLSVDELLSSPVSTDQADAPHKISGVPLYTLLSTFRI